MVVCLFPRTSCTQARHCVKSVSMTIHCELCPLGTAGSHDHVAEFHIVCDNDLWSVSTIERHVGLTKMVNVFDLHHLGISPIMSLRVDRRHCVSSAI